MYGKISFSDELIKNAKFLLGELKNKNQNPLKEFLKKIYSNTTMGPGLQVDPSSACNV